MWREEQPKRTPDVGPVNIVNAGDYLLITAEENGEETALKVSAYNAYRVFAILSMFLTIELPKSIGSKIKL